MINPDSAAVVRASKVRLGIVRPVLEAKGSDSGEYFGPCIRSVHCIRCAQRGALYSRTCNRSIACAVNATHAIFNPSITRSPGTPRARRSAEFAPQPTSAPPPHAAPPTHNPHPPAEGNARAVDAAPARAGRPQPHRSRCGVAWRRRRWDRRTVRARVRRCPDRTARAGTEVRCVHGNAPYRTDSSATDKSGGRCEARKPVNNQSGGSEDPHAPPAMDRERIASRRHTNVTPADKRKHMVVDRVSTPVPPCVRWHAKVYSHGCEMPRNRRPQRP